MKIKVETSNWISYGVKLSSGDDEYRGCKLILKGWGHYVYLYLPQRVLKPARDWRDLSKYVGHESYKWLKPQPDARYGYTEIHPREYGFSYSDRTLHLYYGKQTMEWPGCKSKCIFLPWLEWRFVRHSLHNLDGSLFRDVTKVHYPEAGEHRKAQPVACYEFSDYDGEVIKVRCQVEEREWRAGEGWFKWLSWFRRPKIRRSVDLEFSSEVGKRKGSWKGGTLGHSVDQQPEESITDAFMRYCREHGLTFIAPCEEFASRI